LPCLLYVERPGVVVVEGRVGRVREVGALVVCVIQAVLPTFAPNRSVFLFLLVSALFASVSRLCKRF